MILFLLSDASGVEYLSSSAPQRTLTRDHVMPSVSSLDADLKVCSVVLSENSFHCVLCLVCGDCLLTIIDVRSKTGETGAEVRRESRDCGGRVDRRHG